VTASAVPFSERTPKGVTLTQACNAVADELRASRILIDALDTENSALRERLETEKRATQLLTELNETRRRESEALKQTVVAKNETIAAKDAAIAAQDKLIETLKSKKRSVWSRIADIAIGAAAVVVLK
jgi:septal ring factor EnvC (AmiA/AmiB activator)